VGPVVGAVAQPADRGDRVGEAILLDRRGARFISTLLLHRPADVARYFAIVLGVDGLRWRCADLPAVRRLRAAITRVARHAAQGVAPDPGDVAAINEAAAHPPLVLRVADGAAYLLPGTERQALSTLARDAIDLFRGAHPRLRRRNCGLLFVDASRPGRRRWCSMERCGDRARKRRARGASPQGAA
jgi:predicted RNA-binding Zn ribbon-like protein